MTSFSEREVIEDLMGRIGACLDMPKVLIEALQTSARCAGCDSPEYATVFALARLGKYVMTLPASAWAPGLRSEPRAPAPGSPPTARTVIFDRIDEARRRQDQPGVGWEYAGWDDAHRAAVLASMAGKVAGVCTTTDARECFPHDLLTQTLVFIVAWLEYAQMEDKHGR